MEVWIDTYEKPYVIIHGVKISLDCVYEGDVHAHYRLTFRGRINPASIAEIFAVPEDSEFIQCLVKTLKQHINF